MSTLWRVFVKDGREVLRLPRVVAAVSPRSLWSLGFEQLFIERPALDIRRAANGRIQVAGLDLASAADGGNSPARDWFFAQTEVVIRGGTLTWTDALRDGAFGGVSGERFRRELALVFEEARRGVDAKVDASDALHRRDHVEHGEAVRLDDAHRLGDAAADRQIGLEHVGGPQLGQAGAFDARRHPRSRWPAARRDRCPKRSEPCSPPQ